MFNSMNKIKIFCDHIEGKMDIEYYEVDGYFSFSIEEILGKFKYYQKKCYSCDTLLSDLLDKAKDVYPAIWYERLKNALQNHAKN